MEEISEALRQYGLETVLLALVINLLTAAIKLPVKKLAKRAKNSANITRFIVFLPVLLGFALSVMYVTLIAREKIFGKEFIALWLSSSSLSLTFYAVFEKVMPPKNKSQSSAELKASQELIDKLQAAVNGNGDTAQTGEENDEQTNKTDVDAVGEENKQTTTKIILKGKRNDKTE